MKTLNEPIDTFIAESKRPESLNLKCDEKVYDHSMNFARPHACNRPIFKDGKCKIHCADSVKARAEKSERHWKEKQAAQARMNLNWVRCSIESGKYEEKELQSLMSALKERGIK
jgi:hypothetical protein